MSKFADQVGGVSTPVNKSERSRPMPEDLRRISLFLGPVLLLALCAAAAVGYNAGRLGSTMLWVIASLSVGGAAGFLFGIPKSGLLNKVVPGKDTTSDNGSAAMRGDNDSLRNPSPRAQPNTNLEEVSDWLTKIMVGLTLVNLGNIKTEIGHIAHLAAASIRPEPDASDKSTATALIVAFSLLGFLLMYLYMRLFVQGAFVRSDTDLDPYKNALKAAVRVSEEESIPVPDAHNGAVLPEPVIPSNASVKAAQAVADAAPTDPDVVLKPLRQLANEYESLRSREDYSPSRTRKMSEITKRMQAHAIAAAPYIETLMQSTSTGEHLAATVILQMKYMPEHMEWLAHRLVEERAFIGYQAASALFARVRVAGVEECKALQTAVLAAKAKRKENGSAEDSLDRLIDRILEAT